MSSDLRPLHALVDSLRFVEWDARRREKWLVVVERALDFAMPIKPSDSTPEATASVRERLDGGAEDPDQV